jgi:hypothetical protein
MSQAPQEIGVTAEGRDVHPFAIHGNFQLVGIFEAAHDAQIGSEQSHLELVLAIEGGASA